MERVTIAVYGTLREGFGNHRLIKHCDKIGDGYIGKGYGLFVNGLPYLVEDKDGPGCFCEIYSVDIPTLKRCDMLEGHPDWYRRTFIDIVELSSGHKCKAWVYLYQGPERGEYVRKF